MAIDAAFTQQQPASPFDAVVLGASTGGMSAVSTILGSLPTTFPATVVVCLHRDPNSDPGLLPSILTRRSALPVTSARDNTVLEPGRVVLLPPRSRLAATDEAGFAVETASAATIVDDTMQVLADRYRDRCIGVVLTGKLDDGARGARAIKRSGGRVIVQAPDDAQVSSMPTAVLASGSVDLVVPLRRVAPTLIALAMAPGAADLFRTSRSAWAT